VAREMSFELEWQTSVDSAGLPPLNDFASSSTSFYAPRKSTSPQTTSSSWRPMSTSPTQLRTRTPAGRIAVSRINRCPFEGKPLDLPSEDERIHEQRCSSPRGMAAYVLGNGPYGSCGEEVWRQRRRVIKDRSRDASEALVPIEETLRKRRVLQTSLSAPMLFGGASGTPHTSLKLRQSTVDLLAKSPIKQPPPKSSPRNRVCYHPQASLLKQYRSRELTEASMQSSWSSPATPKQSKSINSLLDSCVKLCNWEDSVQDNSQRDDEARIAKAQLLLAAELDSTSPSKTVLLPRTPLPRELLVRMKDCGWTVGSAVWGQQAREITSSRSVAPAAAGSREIAERIQLLQHLEKGAVPQGIEALRSALRWRCGNLEQAFRSLDVSDRLGRGGISLLEFSGALLLLGLNAPALCGTNETAAFAALDGDMDGRLSAFDLLGDSAPAPSWVQSGFASASQRVVMKGGSEAIEGGAERWVLAIKYVAISAWFTTPATSRRRLRLTGGQTAPAPLQPVRAATPGLTVVTALADGATGRARHGDLARQEASDPVRQCWAPSERDFEDIEGKMKAEFARYASLQQLGEQIINKSDFYGLLGDIPPIGVGEDPEAEQLTRAQLSRIFDEVLALQANSASQNGIQFSKGLTFESFRLALLKISLLMGLHFRHLVDDGIDAQVRTFTG